MQVFISSTYEDLKEYREAVRKAIARLGHEPKGMEDFGSRPTEPKPAALDEVAKCGALVGIYAHRYGTIPTGDSLSVTEQEFDHARKLNIPCFCYRIEPEFPWPPKYVDEGESKKKLEAFLHNKIDKLLRSKFTTPESLSAAVASDLGRELPQGTASPRAAALHSIPCPPADFTGRTSEVERLLKELAGGTRVAISGLAGMGGVGKTALALYVSQEAGKDYPDAHILIELKGTSSTPLSPTEAMIQVIHAFDPLADLRQATKDDIAKLYLSLLNGKRALLLLDNAADAAQVKPLLPPPTCAILVTSRRVFTLPGLQPLRLDVMSESDARDLLLRVCPRIDGRADEIAQLCGRLPLALRIAAAALAENIDLSLDEYTRRLRDGRTRLATLRSETDAELDVEAAFEASYELLPSDAQAKWRALSVFPASFDWSAAMGVWKLNEEDARKMLRGLVRSSLVNYNEESERYSLHDLLSAFADARLGEEERTTAQQLHSAHFQNVSGLAEALYQQGGDAIKSGLGLFDLERMNISAGHDWAVANAHVNKRALELCDEYPGGCANVLSLRQHPRQQIEWFEAASKAAEELDRKQDCGWHLGSLGLAYAVLGDTHKAIEYHEQALAIARATGDKRAEANDLGNLGNAYAHVSEPRKAIEHYEQALAIAREIGDKRGEGTRLGNLGLTYAALGESQKAIEYHEQALAIARQMGDKRGESDRLGSLGIAYADLGELHKAIEYIDQALAIAREMGDRRGESTHLGNLGCAYAAVGDPRGAIGYHQRALAISREIGDKRGEGDHLGNLGTAYSNLGQPREAIDYDEQALTIARAIGDKRGESIHLGSLGNTYASLGEPRKAIELHEQSLAIARAIGDRHGEGENFGNLGIAYAALGEVGKALQYFEQALALSRTIGDKLNEGNQLGNLGNAYLAIGDPLRAIEYHEQALANDRVIDNKHAEGVNLWNLALAYAHLGEPRKAMEHYEQSLAVARETKDEKLEIALLARLGDLYAHDSAQYVRAETAFHRAAELGSEDPAVYGNLGRLLRLRGKLTEAVPLFEKSEQMKPQFFPLLNLAGIYRQLGDSAASMRYAAEARTLVPSDDWYDLACLEAICNNVDAAFENLRRAAREEKFNREWARKDPDLQQIRGDPRFAEIVGPPPEQPPPKHTV